MAAITAVYWDVGGVLLTNGWDHIEREHVLAQFGVDKDAFEARHPEANDEWERGRITAEEYLKRTLFYEPRSFTPQQFLETMRSVSQWLPGSAIQVLQALAASGKVKLAMLNNESHELNDYRVEQFGLHRYFQGIFTSCFLGLRKPEPRMYEVGLALMHQKPDETVFIDDRPNNVAAAAKIGMHAIHYKGDVESLATELRTMGLRMEIPAQSNVGSRTTDRDIASTSASAD